ncbi:tyrosine-type recombinase/integrase [Bradyrhizobium sp. 157]|uniref:tyrosine-type recombinase/integrase n=1 Tax=Bradyrhizobium sp. 157 TaxID=2782631 RepID=UPI001FFB186A
MTKRKRRHRRSVDVRINWLQPHVDDKDWLSQRKYTLATITEVVRLLALWADWVHASGFEVETLAPGLRRIGRCSGAARQLVRHRAPQRCSSPVCVRRTSCRPSGSRRWRRPGRHWPPSVAGCRSSAASRTPRSTAYQAILVDLLVSLGADPAAYTAAAIRGFVLKRAKPHGRGRAQGITVATRAYLKYLVATGQCPVGREQAVPSFANWQLATTPRFLGQADIDRLLVACNGEDRLRDRAVILLLARLGLRASEVANLAFGEIDWVAGRITLPARVGARSACH